MNLDGITADQAGTQIQYLLSSGLRPSPDSSSDPEVVKHSWWLGLKHLPLIAVEAAVSEIIGEDRKWMPTAGELARVARRHLTEVAKAEALGDDQWAEYATGIRVDGPVVRRLMRTDARAKGYQRVSKATCPHEACHCHAVDCEVPTTYERPTARKARPRFETPTPAGRIAPELQRIRMMRIWLWDCEADRIGAKRVGAEAAA